MPTSGFCSILEKILRNSALPKGKFGFFWKKSQSNWLSKSNVCQGVVGFIDLRQICSAFGSGSETSRIISSLIKDSSLKQW